jgi:predicted acetyltransferase
MHGRPDRRSPAPRRPAPEAMLRLVPPDPGLQGSYVAALEELTGEGNGHYLAMVHAPEPGFAGADFTLERLRDPDVFAEFCAVTVAMARPDSPRPGGFVTATSLWIVEGDEVLGRLSLRHALTPFLLEVAGHIGYAVRPSARRRGVATRALALLLPIAADHGIDPALITCDVDNVGSRKVIEANGGVLEDERAGKLRFWVPTG